MSECNQECSWTKWDWVLLILAVLLVVVTVRGIVGDIQKTDCEHLSARTGHTTGFIPGHGCFLQFDGTIQALTAPEVTLILTELEALASSKSIPLELPVKKSTDE